MPDTLKERLTWLARNLWWSWNADAGLLFASIDRDLWRRVGRNPIAFLSAITPAQIEEAAHEPQIVAQLSRIERALEEYLGSEDLWAFTHAPGLVASPVAYFSPEFGLHESLPIYSGGLGVLAGDHLKSCSDLGIRAYGVSLLYTEGYFMQSVDGDGNQVERYVPLVTEEAPVAPALGRDGAPLRVEIPIRHSMLSADVWRTEVGRCPLLLLDVRRSEAHGFPDVLRLYGGGTDTRIFQEIVLGVGGYRALRALGVEPSVIHLNEGHSAFATLEAVADRMEQTGEDFAEASEVVAEHVVFTTHTPVEAGHDRFHPALVLQMLEPLQARLRLSPGELLALGRTDPGNDDEPFCMTTLALKLSRHRNGVSALHGSVARRMWQSLWPTRTRDETPIGHITNGVHVGTWLAPELGQLYADSLGGDWQQRSSSPDTWSGLGELRVEDLWQVKRALKQQLIRHVREILRRRHHELGLTDPVPHLDVSRFTIGFARRFAGYKRAMLLFEDLERTRRLLTDPQRPVQIIIAGKAHAADEGAKGMLRHIVELGKDPSLRDHIVFVPDYNAALGRAMVAGCDLWLNTPRRPLEACGTSGMKAALNGTLNCSTLDGWWNEAFDSYNGFAIGTRHGHADTGMHDRADAESLYQVLESQVIPLFYARNEDDVPEGWLARVKHALKTLAWRYNSDRMVMDYATGAYLVAAKVATADFRR